MKLKIMTPDRTIYDGDVASATIPTKAGQITALEGHDILVSVLESGRLYFRKEAGGEISGSYMVGPGCIEVRHESVMVFTKSARDLNKAN